MRDDNILSQKYRDTAVFSDVIKCRQLLQKSNRANRSQCSRRFSFHSCVLMILYVNFLPLDVVVMLLAFMLALMYADDLLLISSTCSVVVVVVKRTD